MSTISAGLNNTTAIVVTGDTTGNLVLRSNGTTTAVTIDTNQNATFANSVTVTGTINANISGNGASLTNINASNISSGTIGNAFTTAASASGASTIVLRDANGSFAGNVVTATTGSFTVISGNGVSITDINASSITSGVISNTYTTANSANGASTIVARDSNGSFAGNVITATGISATDVNSTNVSATTGAFTNVSGNGIALTAINASNISSGTLDNARTSAASANGASTIVARDSDGSFAGNVISGTSGSFTAVSGNGIALTAINASNIASGAIDNARTTAATANGASTIVLRGSTGEFTAGAITADSISGNGIALTAINASNVSSGTIANARTTAASANGASTIVARDSNGSFTANAGTFTTLSGNLTGNVTLTTGTITTNAANATDITNKAYVDGLITSGTHFHEPVLVEEDVALNAVYVQPNGAGNGVGATLTNSGSNVALVVDGVTVSNTARILVYAQSNAVQNGVYTVTNPGNASAQWVLTRSTDTDTFGLASSTQLSEGSAFFVTAGNTGAGRTYICNTTGTITFGTTNITFAQVSTSQIYSAGTGLTLNNLAFSIANTAVTAATYGNDGAVSQIAVNAQGQITAASNVSINASSISVGTLANGRTTAASANGASTIVARDSNGSFSANVVTAGTGSFTVVSGNGIALTAINASNISSGTIANARTTADSANGANTIVLRDASGDFEVDGITANWFTGNGANLSAINASNVSSGTLSATRGGTGSANLTAENVILGNGANTVKVVAPGTANNVLTSNGTTWISQAPSGGGGATITNDNTTASALFPLFTSSTSGTLSAASVNSAKLTYTPSTGNLVATIMYASSDSRHKTDIKNIPDALVKISQINGVTYIRTDNDQNIRHAGVIAQEVEAILPEVIGTDADGYKVVAYGNMIGLLVEAIKELKAEVDALKG
jgi:exosome complex RNA-binding protein Rrp4